VIEAIKERADQTDDFDSRILLQEVSAGDQVRPFCMWQQQLEPVCESGGIEDFILTSPNDHRG
jgi:hypothetical protein